MPVNTSSAVTTLGLGLGVAQTADVITWLSHWPLTAPPDNVTLTLAAGAVGLAHFVTNLVANRNAAKAAALPPVTPQTVIAIPPVVAPPPPQPIAATP